MDELIITPQDNRCLIENLEFSLEYETKEEYFIGNNEELGINATANTIQELRQAISHEIDFMINTYIIQGYKDINKELAEYIENLKEIVDPTKYIDGKWVKIKEDQ